MLNLGRFRGADGRLAGVGCGQPAAAAERLHVPARGCQRGRLLGLREGARPHL